MIPIPECVLCALYINIGKGLNVTPWKFRSGSRIVQIVELQIVANRFDQYYIAADIERLVPSGLEHDIVIIHQQQQFHIIIIIIDTYLFWS